MSLLQGGILGLITTKLSYLTQKQSVLAQNVSNADTPAYKAKTLESFASYLSHEGEGRALKKTNETHIIPASLSGVNSKAKEMGSFEVVPTGNSVDLEQQMMEVSKTTIDYQASIGIYQKFAAMIKTAAGK